MSGQPDGDSQATASRLRVLVAEDEEVLRRYILRAIALLGCEPVGVGSVDDLERSLQVTSPDAVLLDWNLDEGDARHVVSSLQHRGIPVVVMTGDPQGGATQVGAPVLAKPLELDQLRHRLEALCRRS